MDETHIIHKCASREARNWWRAREQ